MLSKKYIYVITILIGLVVLSGCSNNSKNGKVNIVASTDFYAEMAEAVVGKDASVTAVIKSTDTNPHDYEPTTTVAKKYAKANIIISNGAGYDVWSTKFSKQNQSAKSISVDKLVNYKSGENEHLWYKIETPKKLVEAVKGEMIKQNPKRKDFYNKNAKEYLKKYQNLEKLQKEAKVLLKNKNYLATEPVYDNTLNDLGATNNLKEFSEAIEQGNDPTAKSVKTWKDLIDRQQISFVVKNSQVSGRAVKNALTYAREKHVPIISVTETKPKNMTYIEWQESQLKQINSALKVK